MSSASDPMKPPYVHFFGVMGATAAMVFSGKSNVLFRDVDIAIFVD